MARRCESETCRQPTTRSLATRGDEERSTSSTRKVCPGSSAMRARAAKAARGATAPGMIREFDETRTNPACVAGQVAHPVLRALRNHAVAGL